MLSRYSFIYLCLYGLMVSSVIQCYYQINPLLIWWSNYGNRLVSFLSSIFEHFFAFWYKIFQAYLKFFLPQPCNQLFLQGSLVPFTVKWYLKSNTRRPGVLIAFEISHVFGLHVMFCLPGVVGGLAHISWGCSSFLSPSRKLASFASRWHEWCQRECPPSWVGPC